MTKIDSKEETIQKLVKLGYGDKTTHNKRQLLWLLKKASDRRTK